MFHKKSPRSVSAVIESYTSELKEIQDFQNAKSTELQEQIDVLDAQKKSADMEAQFAESAIEKFNAIFK